jgi:hypothetical protein
MLYIEDASGGPYAKSTQRECSLSGLSAGAVLCYCLHTVEIGGEGSQREPHVTRERHVTLHGL